jgi:hypothetical protein
MWFESRERRRADASELNRLSAKYGDQVVDVLHLRVRDPLLTPRDRSHWKRILRKARR